MSRHLVAVSLVALLVGARPAGAQSAAAIAIGAVNNSFDVTGKLTFGTASVGPLLRLRTGPGLGVAIGFNWHAIGVDMKVDDRVVPVGQLRVRPIMGGVAYHLLREPYDLSLSVVAGYAFTGIGVDGRTREAYARSLGVGQSEIDVTNTFVWRSQIGLWYDVTDRIGIMAGLAYIRSRPKLVLTTDLGVERRPLGVSPVVLSFGVAYGVF